jgi:hypothetical protein
MTSKAQAQPILQPNGDTYAFLCETPEAVADLPYYYLCGLQEQTHFVYPHMTTQYWMAGSFCAVGLVKG